MSFKGEAGEKLPRGVGKRVRVRGSQARIIRIIFKKKL
jgi:hypothetical protein